MKISPLNDVILVQPVAPKSVSSGGIRLPTLAPGSFRRGTVLAKGPGKLLGNGQRVPVPCEVGDIILCAPSKNVVKFEEQECYLLQTKDILAVEKK
jgi:chaperonin GroES